MPVELDVLVFDENGAKLEDIPVTLAPMGSGEGYSAKTGRWGIAAFHKVAAGPYSVSVSHAKFGLAALFVTLRDNTSQQVSLTLYPLRHIYFAIYYENPDGAFRRAAKTWEREVRAMKKYDSRNDKVLVLGQSTEGDFKKAWNVVYQEGNLPGRRVVEGRLFTHASYDTDNDGLEFKHDETGGTLDRKEIGALPKLNWDLSGKLVMHGCNTGYSDDRDWSPASVLANAQGVLVEGLRGYGYFSTKRDSYSRINDSSDTVYLFAYDRGWNFFRPVRQKGSESTFYYKPR